MKISNNGDDDDDDDDDDDTEWMNDSLVPYGSSDAANVNLIQA